MPRTDYSQRTESRLIGGQHLHTAKVVSMETGETIRAAHNFPIPEAAWNACDNFPLVSRERSLESKGISDLTFCSVVDGPDGWMLEPRL